MIISWVTYVQPSGGATEVLDGALTQGWKESNKLITHLHFKVTNQRGNKIREEGGGTVHLCTSEKAFK